METEEIQKLLQAHFPDAKITVTGDGYHFEVSIISHIFSDKSKVKQQQMVYAVLNPYIIRGDIHAVSLNIGVP